MGPGGDMMFGVFIQAFNLSGGGFFPKLFDVILEQAYFVNGLPTNSTRLTMEQCTQAHFKGFPFMKDYAPLLARFST